MPTLDLIVFVAMALAFDFTDGCHDPTRTPVVTPDRGARPGVLRGP
jgi:hypothetical protein